MGEGTKDILFKDLSSRLVRDRVDLLEAFEEYPRVQHDAKDVLIGSMAYEERSGRQYLYRRSNRNSVRMTKSLGARSPETDEILEHFNRQKLEAEERLSSLSFRIDELAALMRALGHQRVPSIAARLIRKLNESASAARFRVVGTHALYAYEAAASVTFASEMLATGDLDVLVDDRAPLKIVIDGQIRGFQELARAVDQTFVQRKRGDYRLTNKDGFMVEFIRPEARPAHRPMPGQSTNIEGDAQPAPINGLEWLVSAPEFTAVAVDDRGYPVRLVVPAPAVWAAHKLWVSRRPDRDPGKATRDRVQAHAVLQVINAKLPNERLDPQKHSALPKAVADLLSQVTNPTQSKRTEPDW